MLENGTIKPRNSTAVYRLIVERESGPPKLLTVELGDGGRALPVFTWEEEARLFLRFGRFAKDGWRIVECTPEQLAVMLAQDDLAHVGFVALDPLPEPVWSGMIRLVSIEREKFVDRLVG
jgi:hypothetical protein